MTQMHRRELIDESHSQTAYPPPTHTHVHAHPQTDQDLMSHSRFSQSLRWVLTILNLIQQKQACLVFVVLDLI